MDSNADHHIAAVQHVNNHSDTFMVCTAASCVDDGFMHLLLLA
jgi:hypothetical protein